MSTKHTPGPWQFDGNKRILGPETPDELPVIAEVYGAACEDQDGYANAALIASAPELLEALDYLQSMPNDPRAHRKALDVLAKAKGTL